MKAPLLAVLITLLSLVALRQSYEAYKWKQVADQRGFVAEQAAKYLFAPTDILGADGQPLRRVDILDAILANAVKK